MRVLYLCKVLLLHKSFVLNYLKKTKRETPTHSLTTDTPYKTNCNSCNLPAKDNY